MPYGNLSDRILIYIVEMIFKPPIYNERIIKDMGINRCILFLDTPLGSLEAETV